MSMTKIAKMRKTNSLLVSYATYLLVLVLVFVLTPPPSSLLSFLMTPLYPPSPPPPSPLLPSVGPDFAQQLAALNRAIGNSVPTLPRLSIPLVDDPLYQLDPPTRKPSNSKASSDRVMSDNINKATDALKEGM